MRHSADDAADRRFRELVLPHLDDAYSLARWLAGSASDAEDIVQEACLRALQAPADARISSPRAWFLAVLRNAAYTWMAKNRPAAIVLSGGAEEAELHPSAAPTDGAPCPEIAMIAAAERESVQNAIADLPLPFREALVMREINGLSYRDIALTTGVPVGTVMSRLARARALLVAKLGAAR